MREIQVVAALVRSGNELLMIEQAGPGEEPHWSIPAGRVEPGEFVVDALVREVREETGIVVVDPGRLAFMAQIDHQPDRSFASVWTWEVAAWSGAPEVTPADPDGLVRRAAWQPLGDAVAHLRRISWQALTVGYLAGTIERGAVALRRVRADGSEEPLRVIGAA